MSLYTIEVDYETGEYIASADDWTMSFNSPLAMEEWLAARMGEDETGEGDES